MARKALLVGINRYPDPENCLRGCVNDVLQVSELLRSHFGFDDRSQMRLLVDERARTGAIVDRLRWLMRGATAGDVLVFHYSGHGAQVRDRSGDELDDGLDEIICPYDLDWDDPFTDDDLGDVVGAVPPGVSLTVILDCCHSGTGLRVLPGSQTASAPGHVRARCLTPPADIAHRAAGDEHVSHFGRRARQAGAVLIAGCRADQVSADALIEGQYRGALTHFLCRAIADTRYAGSYKAVIGRVRTLLRANRYDQTPQLEGPSPRLTDPVFAPLPITATRSRTRGQRETADRLRPLDVEMAGHRGPAATA